MEINKPIINDEIYYKSVLRDEVRKNDNKLRPLLEAITNSLESIATLNEKKEGSENNQYKITINLYHKSVPGKDEIREFEQITIEDTGIGFNDENFDRLKRYKDDRKGKKNKGSGRMQFLKFFDRSEYISIYKDGEKYKERKFFLSKQFIEQNAIIFYNYEKESEVNKNLTSLTFSGVLEKEDKVFYNDLKISKLKEEVLSHYMMYFCMNKKKLPLIEFIQYLNNDFNENTTIVVNEIPESDKEKTIDVELVKLSTDKKNIEKTGKSEKLLLKAFVISKTDLKENKICLTSKGEIANYPQIKLDVLKSNDFIEGNRYLFLLSGEYLDSKDTDDRGVLSLRKEKEIRKPEQLKFGSINKEGEIIIEDIQKKSNDAIISIYPEIKTKTDEQYLEIQRLKDMFLISNETLNSVRFGLNDSEGDILKAVYSAEAEIVAKKDIKIKESFDKLNELNPSSKDYDANLCKIAAELTKSIPMQNKASLVQYVARRELVLDVFDKILDRELEIQKSSKRNIDEKLLHNLIFQQSSNNPEDSDLWLINEDFLYFKGVSESKLFDLEFDGIKIMKESLNSEEEEYRKIFEKDRLSQKPDVLFFPDEGKCIIIEFKNPSVDVSDHINQINNYASLIRNLSKNENPINTFYGYLIGEKIDINSFQDKNPYFESAYHLDYLFRPYYPVKGKFGRDNGSLYTEVIKYSTLLERAKLRNKIFREKLLSKRLESKPK